VWPAQLCYAIVRVQLCCIIGCTTNSQNYSYMFYHDYFYFTCMVDHIISYSLLNVNMCLTIFFFFAAVMQTDGFDYLQQSCPYLLTELLEYVAKVGEHSVSPYLYSSEILDGGDANGRRVKPRI
jgi:hypothetical protein